MKAHPLILLSAVLPESLHICTAKRKADDSVSRLKLKHLMELRAPPNVTKKKTKSCISAWTNWLGCSIWNQSSTSNRDNR